MRRIIFSVLLFPLVVSVGCTSINVQSLSADLNIKEVCIEDNPKVIVGDFLPVVRNGFDRHNLITRVVNRPAPEDCQYVLTYTALQTWDMAMYMHHAELRMESKGRLVGSAIYHLNGKGGLSLAKWASVKSKMDPVIDQLLKNVNL